MFCEPCGKNIVYHRSAACTACYADLLKKAQQLSQQLEAAEQRIISLETERAERQ